MASGLVLVLRSFVILTHIAAGSSKNIQTHTEAHVNLHTQTDAHRQCRKHKHKHNRGYMHKSQTGIVLATRHELYTISTQISPMFWIVFARGQTPGSRVPGAVRMAVSQPLGFLGCCFRTPKEFVCLCHVLLVLSSPTETQPTAAAIWIQFSLIFQFLPCCWP